MAVSNNQVKQKCKRLAYDISRVLKKDCDIKSVNGTNIFTSYLDAEVAISVTETNGTYAVLAAQNNQIVFDMTYRKRSWSKTNIYRPEGTWENVIKNRLSGNSNSNVLYRSAWFTD